MKNVEGKLCNRKKRRALFLQGKKDLLVSSRKMDTKHKQRSGSEVRVQKLLPEKQLKFDTS